MNLKVRHGNVWSTGMDGFKLPIRWWIVSMGQNCIQYAKAGKTVILVMLGAGTCGAETMVAARVCEDGVCLQHAGLCSREYCLMKWYSFQMVKVCC